MNYIAIDIGGTKTLLAVFNSEGQIIEKIKFPTPQDYKDFLLELKKAKTELSNQSFAFGAIGTRGLLDTNNGVLVSDNLLDWPNTPLVNDFTSIFEAPFTLGNDSKLAGLSEASLIKDSRQRKIVYITVSTGIGTVFVVDKKIDQNTITSEVGKWLFPFQGELRTWESFASGKAIYEKYSLKASDIENEAIWQDICSNLALGIVNITSAYTPDLIIVGGGVGEHFEKFGSILNQLVAELTPVSVTKCPIIGAKRSEEAVIYGAYLLARQKFDA